MQQKRREIKSFVLRQGRMSNLQSSSLLSGFNQYGLDSDTDLSCVSIFHNNNPLAIEIGFGMGDSLYALACNNPDKNYIGIEVHRPGVGALLAKLLHKSLDNLKIYNHDAVEILKHRVADNSVNEFIILFPDPWPKNRHHKRRIISQDFVSLLLQKLTKNGTIHFATDWEDYAYWTLNILEKTEDLKNNASVGFIERPSWRVLTKFEARGFKLGHKTWDIQFTKI